jgi:hypothetical protein
MMRRLGPAVVMWGIDCVSALHPDLESEREARTLRRIRLGPAQPTTNSPFEAKALAWNPDGFHRR